MIKYILVFFLTIFISCNKTNSSENYELYKAEKENGVLILFPGFSGGIENTKSEFKILDVAKKNGISIIFMNFGEHVNLSEIEKESLKNELQIVFKNNNLKYDNIYIGGFSAGGNVSLLLGDFLIKTKSRIVPKGIFIVDSPIDLLKIYEVSKKNIIRNKGAESIDESKWIIENFTKNFGNPKDGIKNYEKNSPFTFKSLNLKNVENLKLTKLRFYTEPDLEWWKQSSGNNYEELNAYSIEKMSEEMKRQNFNSVEVIKTKNKGIRANGEKHPHSWSIVDVNDLMKWILNNKNSSKLIN